MRISREQALGHRFAAQQLDRSGGHDPTDAAVLDLGVQDTGSDGAAWALVNRGADVPALADAADRLVLVWSLRGAPHVYRRADVAAVAAATAPFSEVDAEKRIFDAARPLRAAGIRALDALDVVAAQMREVAATPVVKGEISAALTQRLPDPYLRYCRPCAAVHCYEQPFRLAALRAGLELQPGTSPPVLQPIPGWTGPAAEVPSRLDVVRGVLRLLGPTTPKLVAGFLDAPVGEVRARWPADVEEVRLGEETRWVLAEDRPALESAGLVPQTLRLLAPYDLFLQARDREVLVPKAARRKRLWVVLGRPGAVVAGGEVVGTWRPRASGGRLRLLVDLWSPVPLEAVEEQGHRLAAHRRMSFAGLLEE